MAGVIYPDFGNALLKGAQLRSVLDEREALDRRRGLAPHVQSAMGGDRDALGHIASVDPDYAMRIAPLLDRLDANKQATLKRAAEFTTQAGMGILNSPPEHRAAAFLAARTEAQRQGIPTDTWPTQWGPQTEGWLQFNVNKAVPVAEWFKARERRQTEADGMPQPLPGYGTAAGPHPFNIGNVRPVGASVGFQQPATFDDGVRLAVNTVKAYPAKFNQGQPMTLLQIGERWAPVGDGANDPAQWARNVAAFSGLDPNQPLDFNDPVVATAFARGVHGAEKGAQAVKPSQVYAQALQGGPPQGDGSGNPAPPAPAPAPTAPTARDLAGVLPPGVVPLGDRKTGLPLIRDGRVAVQMPNGQRTWMELPKPPKEQGPGPFQGTSLDAQAMNILLGGDPASPEYAMAYAHMSRPRTTIDPEGRPVVVQPMDLSMVRPPAGARRAPQEAPQGTTQALPGGGSVTVLPSVAPKGATPKEQADLRAMRAESDAVIAAAEDFRREWQKASVAEKRRALTGATTPLNTAYNNFALLAKGEALFNLGVLNGPDLEIIRRTIPDPSTWHSLITRDTDMTSAVDKVINLIRGKVEAKGRQVDGAGASSPQPAAGGDIKKKYGLE